MLASQTLYFPSSNQVTAAADFTNFDATLNVVYDERATKVLGKKFYRVTQSFRFFRSREESNVWAYVPAGYLSDGASVPRLFQWLLPAWGRYGQAAVLHDILCDTLQLFKNSVPVPITRKEADHLFLDGMVAAKVPWLTRMVLFAAVRLWGMFGWRPKAEWLAKKRALESEYMKSYGTYRDPSEVFTQVSIARCGTQVASEAH